MADLALMTPNDDLTTLGYIQRTQGIQTADSHGHQDLTSGESGFFLVLVEVRASLSARCALVKLSHCS